MEQVSLSPEQRDAVAAWQCRNGVADRADALARLVEIGLEERYLVAHSKGEFSFDLDLPSVTHKPTGFRLTVPGYGRPADVGPLGIVETAGTVAGEEAAVLRGAAIAYLRRVLLRAGAG